MTDGAGQWAAGNHNVQINNVANAAIRITYGGRARSVPLEPATIPISPTARSPARLLRPRSGVLPYTARGAFLAQLDRWVQTPRPFALCIIGGRGGTGKTRLGVELCSHATSAGWLAGMLHAKADQGALEALGMAPTARLVVIDYAETKSDQLELVLPLLAQSASSQWPVRVVALVRARPSPDGDWTAVLRAGGDALDALLDDASQWPLEDQPLSVDERRELFVAAAGPLAEYADPRRRAPAFPQSLDMELFASPLLVVVAAYLAVHGSPDTLPATRAELLDGLLEHEARYWRSSAQAQGLDADAVLQRRVVALATLAGAAGEREAAGLLALINELSGPETNERRHRLARWAHSLYPAADPGVYWGPLEPDLLGEHLVARTFSDRPDILAGVLNRPSPPESSRPLDVYARAAPDHPALASALEPILSRSPTNVAVAHGLVLDGQRLANGELDFRRFLKLIGRTPSVFRTAARGLGVGRGDSGLRFFRTDWNTIAFGPGAGLVLGVLIGASSVRAAIVDANGFLHCHHESDYLAGQLSLPPHDLLDRIRRAAGSVIENALGNDGLLVHGTLPFLGIAAAWASPLGRDKRPRGGLLRHADWNGRSTVTEYVARHLGVAIERSHAMSAGHAAAFGVAWRDTREPSHLRQEHPRLTIVVRLDEDISGGFVVVAPPRVDDRSRTSGFIDARLIGGDDQLAGGLAHISVDRGLVARLSADRPEGLAPLIPADCSCGWSAEYAPDHLEAYCSTRALALRIAPDLAESVVIARVLTQPSRQIHQRALGDIGTMVGQALQGAATALNPSAIVLVGRLAVPPVANAAYAYIERAQPFGAGPVLELVDEEAAQFIEVQGAALAVFRTHVYRQLHQLLLKPPTGSVGGQLRALTVPLARPPGS